MDESEECTSTLPSNRPVHHIPKPITRSFNSKQKRIILKKIKTHSCLRIIDRPRSFHRAAKKYNICTKTKPLCSRRTRHKFKYTHRKRSVENRHRNGHPVPDLSVDCDRSSRAVLFLRLSTVVVLRANPPTKRLRPFRPGTVTLRRPPHK